jgi:hypothetical protein
MVKLIIDFKNITDLKFINIDNKIDNLENLIINFTYITNITKLINNQTEQIKMDIMNDLHFWDFLLGFCILL